MLEVGFLGCLAAHRDRDGVSERILDRARSMAEYPRLRCRGDGEDQDEQERERDQPLQSPFRL